MREHSTPAERARLFACALANTPDNVRVVRPRVTKVLSGRAACHPESPDYGTPVGTASGQ